MKLLILLTSIFLINCAQNNSSKSAVANSCGDKELFTYWENEDGTTALDLRGYKQGINTAYYTHNDEVICKFDFTISGDNCTGVYSTSNVEFVGTGEQVDCKAIIPDRNGEYKKTNSGLSMHNLTEDIYNNYK